MGNGGEELELSQEMLAALPSDPYEQLDMARCITARAVVVLLSKLETESGQLRQRLAEKEHVILGLQDRMFRAQSTLQETNAKVLLSLDEQAKLVNEKNALASQVKKLFRDVEKLETFKRTLTQSLQEEDDRPRGIENRGGLPPSLMTLKASQLAESAVNKSQSFENHGQHVKLDAESSSKDNEFVVKSVLRPSSGRNTPKLQSTRTSTRGTPASLTPRLTPTGSPRPSVHALDSPQIRIPMSLPSSRAGSRSSSPSRGSRQPRTTQLDGKDFFRLARSRLSYEQFSLFLANIKELNAHRQTREEALCKAESIFGPENKDLYSTFEGILSRHSPS